MTNLFNEYRNHPATVGSLGNNIMFQALGFKSKMKVESYVATLDPTTIPEPLRNVDLYDYKFDRSGGLYTTAETILAAGNQTNPILVDLNNKMALEDSRLGTLRQLPESRPITSQSDTLLARLRNIQGVFEEYRLNPTVVGTTYFYQMGTWISDTAIMDGNVKTGSKIVRQSEVRQKLRLANEIALNMAANGRAALVNLDGDPIRVPATADTMLHLNAIIQTFADEVFIENGVAYGEYLDLESEISAATASLATVFPNVGMGTAAGEIKLLQHINQLRVIVQTTAREKIGWSTVNEYSGLPFLREYIEPELRVRLRYLIDLMVEYRLDALEVIGVPDPEHDFIPRIQQYHYDEAYVGSTCILERAREIDRAAEVKRSDIVGVIGEMENFLASVLGIPVTGEPIPPKPSTAEQAHLRTVARIVGEYVADGAPLNLTNGQWNTQSVNTYLAPRYASATEYLAQDMPKTITGCTREIDGILAEFRTNDKENYLNKSYPVAIGGFRYQFELLSDLVDAVKKHIDAMDADSDEITLKQDLSALNENAAAMVETAKNVFSTKVVELCVVRWSLEDFIAENDLTVDRTKPSVPGKEPGGAGNIGGIIGIAAGSVAGLAVAVYLGMTIMKKSAGKRRVREFNQKMPPQSNPNS
jgi:hypothetical protein